MDIFGMLFNSLMEFLTAQSLVHSFLPYVQPLLVQSYLNSMLPITQIYLEPDSWNFDSGTAELTNCLVAVQVWMGNTKLN